MSHYPSQQQYQSEIAWEKGRAKEFCPGNCEHGPGVSNLSFGPDGGGSRLITACTRHCASCIRSQLEGAWVRSKDMGEYEEEE